MIDLLIDKAKIMPFESKVLFFVIWGGGLNPETYPGKPSCILEEEEGGFFEFSYLGKK